jgi:hypothetical protein
VPSRDVREGEGAGLKCSHHSRDGWGCGVDEGGKTEHSDVFVLPAPADPYIDFAFGLDGTTHENPGMATEPSAAAGLDYPSVSETLRCLESAMGLPTSADTTVDLAPMDIDATFSISTPQRLSTGAGETRHEIPLNGSGSPRLLPFHLSTSKLPALAPPLSLTRSGLNSLLKAPVEVRPQSPHISATVSGLGLPSGSVESVSPLINQGSAEMQEVFAGPSLFLDDGGME